MSTLTPHPFIPCAKRGTSLHNPMAHCGITGCGEPPSAEIHNVIDIANTAVALDGNRYPVENPYPVPSEEWVTCADCGQRRATSTLAEGHKTFVCRRCLGMNPAPPAEKGASETVDAAVEAPEKIWIDPKRRSLKWVDYAFEEGVEYVRADSGQCNTLPAGVAAESVNPFPLTEVAVDRDCVVTHGDRDYQIFAGQSFTVMLGNVALTGPAERNGIPTLQQQNYTRGLEAALAITNSHLDHGEFTHGGREECVYYITREIAALAKPVTSATGDNNDPSIASSVNPE